MKKKNWLIGIFMFGLVFLASCSSGNNTGIDDSSSSSSIDAELVKLTIAAAVSLEYALQERLIPMFEEKNKKITVEGSYDSSGKLQTQIEEGMSADLFFSAAEKQMNALIDQGLIEKSNVSDVLENKLVLIVPKDKKSDYKSFEDIENAKTIALGDPESIPVGQYAEEALIWDNIQDHVSWGTNVNEVLN